MERKILKLSGKIDYFVVFSVLGLLVMGLLALYSSSQVAISTGVGTNFFLKQVFWILLGIILVVMLYFFPNKWIFEISYLLYGISLFFLILVLIIGSQKLGTSRWLQLGSFSFQPSELAKIATVLAVSRFVSKEKVDLNNVKFFAFTCLLIVLPFLLIVREPDLGTSLVFIAMALPIFYWGGLKGGNLVLIITPFVVVFASFQFYAFLIVMVGLVVYLVYSKRHRVVIVSNFLVNVFMGLLTPILWNQLHPYQQNRIKIFLNPESDPRGAGYQIIQSKVAIGSGGLFGTGIFQGSQTQLRFLPEQHTDFIFAVIGEELGFMGVILGLLLFLILFLRVVQIGAQTKSIFNSIVVIGFTTILVFHVLVNIGMTIGFLPVTGLPLPLISYGGSALITNLVMIGIILNIYKNRFDY
jgi:rod shape determining protein RodA